MDRVN